MPYISEKDKQRTKALLYPIKAFIEEGKECPPGFLNYIITEMCISYIKREGLSYKTCNDVMGVFNGASKEFYRRVVAPYEDKKIKENGDVYENIHKSRET